MKRGRKLRKAEIDYANLHDMIVTLLNWFTELGFDLADRVQGALS